MQLPKLNDKKSVKRVYEQLLTSSRCGKRNNNNDKDASSQIDLIVKRIWKQTKKKMKNIIVDIFNTLVGELKD